MYESFFGLKEKPFRISPDPRFLYLAPQHREVLSKCQYMISSKVGPVYVFGPDQHAGRRDRPGQRRRRCLRDPTPDC
jgi:hypothetical protein